MWVSTSVHQKWILNCVIFRLPSTTAKTASSTTATEAPPTPSREYIYSGGLLAKIESSTTTYYYPDHLSTRMTIVGTGTPTQQGHFPFGENWYPTSTTEKWKFTSYERDTESGNDYAIFRSYVNRYGRFLTPDPAGVAAAGTSNPQMWNRYTYANNNPVLSNDPLGLQTASASFNCVNTGEQPAGEITQPLCNPGYTPPSNGTSSIPGNDLPPAIEYGGNINECSVDPYCIVAGGINPLNHPTATPGRNYANSYLEGNRYYYYDMIIPPERAECNANGCTAILISPIYVKTFLGIGSSGAQGLKKPSLDSGSAGNDHLTAVISGTAILPFFGGIIGPAFTYSYVPESGLLCVGAGGGASFGRAVSLSGGVISSQNAEAILSGGSVSGGFQLSPFSGVGLSANSSGSTSNWSFGSTGASATLTYSWCF